MRSIWKSTALIPEADRNRLILYVCDEAFRFRDNAVVGTFQRWTGAGLDWSIHGGRTVHLYYDEVAPTLVSTARAGSRVTLTFDEDLDADSVPAMGAFAVEVGRRRRRRLRAPTRWR